MYIIDTLNEVVILHRHNHCASKSIKLNDPSNQMADAAAYAEHIFHVALLCNRAFFHCYRCDKILSPA